MKEISRRRALKYLLAGGIAMASAPFLDACQKMVAPSTAAAQVSTSTDEEIPTVNPPETSQPVETAATERQYPDLVVARHAEPEQLVQAAIESIGGLQRFIPAGGWVIIKPNICTSYHSFEYATTTNPWVVGALVKMCFDAGAGKVQVMDFPFGGTPQDAYAVSGIADQVAANGGEMVVMPGFKFKNTAIENALSLAEIPIYEDVFKANALINVPIAKDHGMSRLTLGMKNLMGLIQNREQIHWDFGNRLTDLARMIKPALTVIDAVRILTANGPTGGNLNDVRQMDTVIVSPDIVAADSYAATLFGLQPEDLEFVRVGARAGLGRSDLSSMTIQEIDLAA